MRRVDCGEWTIWSQFCLTDFGGTFAQEFWKGPQTLLSVNDDSDWR